MRKKDIERKEKRRRKVVVFTQSEKRKAGYYYLSPDLACSSIGSRVFTHTHAHLCHSFSFFFALTLCVCLSLFRSVFLSVSVHNLLPFSPKNHSNHRTSLALPPLLSPKYSACPGMDP